MTRVYVPATIETLKRLVADSEFEAVSGTAFAVTPALREAYTSGDDEELAEVAMAEAARASLRLLAGRADDDPPPEFGLRRVVVAADVDGVTLRPDLDDAVVRLPGPVPLSAVASVHVDLAAAEPDIARALPVVDAADLGDEEAEFVLGDAEDHELAWYATQELQFLLELL
ncbi:hypothetical protein D092_05300 [Rhodococcus ruber Chol-4]|uniref:Uncharacterized protein n=1 Tax=Rhodococcus ruber TaxID=1830 RepID=A0A098BL07_9NOCA|nr:MULTISPECIES: hypothetical protein [Rhodococcus]AUM17461.1 hypothetical protein CSW53_13620 [Rhodococcus ruber]AWG99840.1 hypothetical protein DCN13_15490 [Rhodococcus ruber]KXF86916.1 hypothetical protein D092_05300 [Rhodococcus ruber Chol-4]MBP2212366.1 hypothetical protein [Rhodococcus ruber]MCD2126009.1 hypothetical protein [Rhodococcus ruber]